MAMGGRGGVRSNGGGDGGAGGFFSVIRNLFSYRILVLATFSLVFVATVSVIFSSHLCHRTHSGIQTTGSAYGVGNSLALYSYPSKNRLNLVQEQDINQVYAAYARKLKAEIFRQLNKLEDLSNNLFDQHGKPSNRAPTFDDDRRRNKKLLRRFKEEAKDRIKVARSMIADANEFDNSQKIQKLKDTIFSINDLLVNVKKKNTALASLLAAESIPKSLHCLTVRLMEEAIANPQNYADVKHKGETEDPSLYHYAIFSDNVIAVSVVVNSAAKNAKEPRKHVFHIVTNRMTVAAMKVWFKMRPIEGGAHVEVKSVEDFPFWNSSYVPVLSQLAKLEESTSSYNRRLVIKNIRQRILGRTKDSSLSLKYLLFYLPQMYPGLHKILFLDEDVVVQKDMSALWEIDMDGNVNGAVETCSGSLFRYSEYLNFSNPLIEEKFHPDACAWSLGMNIFDLDAWRRENCTENYQFWQNLNENQTLWKLDTLPAGLVTFNALTKPLQASWHVNGLGQDPSISMHEIYNAAVIHFSGFMKPWSDYSMSHYKNFWSKYVDSDMAFLQMCNFGR